VGGILNPPRGEEKEVIEVRKQWKKEDPRRVYEWR